MLVPAKGCTSSRTRAELVRIFSAVSYEPLTLNSAEGGAAVLDELKRFAVVSLPATQYQV